ncbi:MAG: SLC13 family permease [Chloroflexi bacterium]|nr:MAG: SLC13 family permease [Chloroflexota bacterium]
MIDGRRDIFGLDFQIILLIGILITALILFSIEKISADVVGLGVLIALILTNLLPADLAFAGFGSETVLMLLGLFILTASLTRTGVVDLAGRQIVKRTRTNPKSVVSVISVSAAALSSFISNTASAAFFLPVTMGLARRMRISVSELLMPLAFASILSSSVTLISTSTNIVVSGLITQFGMEPISMFELAPVGVPILIVGLLYLHFFHRWMVPNRKIPETLTEEYGLRPYLTELIILPNSALIGKTLLDASLGRDLDLTVIRIVRNKTRYFQPDANLILQRGDVLLVEGRADDILKIKDTGGIDIKADAKLTDPDLVEEDLGLVEAILLPRSPLIGRTLKGVQFRERYGLQVLAVNRGDETIRRKISSVPLRMGDVLLVQGPVSRINILQEDKIFEVMGVIEDKRPNVRRAPLAIAIFAGVLLLATFNVISLAVAVLLGALLSFLTRCITPEEAYRDVEWKALILIGSMLGLGTAMQVTGTADFLASQIVSLVGSTNPYILLSAFFVLTVVLTQPMSNQAAAAVVIPVALQTAVQLGLNPRTFAMMIAVAASTSYLTPLEPACLMVYGPGHYKFFDFVRAGSLLTIAIYLIAIILVPMVWPF